MEPLIDSIVQKLHHLPQPKLNEVLNFVEFLTWQEKGENQLDVSESTAEINPTFEDIADRLAEEFAKSVGTNLPLLSDYAVSRAGIYEEHP
ncbi:hypothetical protein [Argonema antarcticum]|uniref:hypothetical protein n=1 Tax=Argonema antarcticum TaxID=2942763 RepID=UPI0020134947|nr:hypothetical protein [Argonema antarcticum]MCL1473234.1 hypothetical protein [Argonema antarcticum A004/B2]